MRTLNEVLGASRDPEPPMRDIEGNMIAVRVRGIPDTHALTSRGTNGEESDDDRLPPPQQPLLTILDHWQVAELIEHHIDYIDPESVGNPRSVHLPSEFVWHFQNRTDGLLPIVKGVVTLPLVLRDGALLSGGGLNRQHRLVFRVPPELLAVLLRREECDKTAVAEAMQFLTDEWLCDVATDYAGKCVLVALALSLIERALLPDRPVFFVTAGRRGGGKTTVLNMLMMAITGVRPSASPWSGAVEERRKALLAYLTQAPPAIIWDNIPRGTAIQCPYIEMSCTTETYKDRVLGESKLVEAQAQTFHLFTGNNIGPKGDVSSRSLRVTIDVDRPDPENRAFRHPHPIQWTEANRGRILGALYTVLLGNPRLRLGNHKPAETRFKDWWELVGSAVEHAAQHHAGHVEGLTMERNAACPPARISFKDLFLSGEQDDEDTASLVDLLEALADKANKDKAGNNPWRDAKTDQPKTTFTAAELAQVVNDQGDPRHRSEVDKHLAAVVREVLFPAAKPYDTITPKALGKRLHNHKGEPILSGKRTLTLREQRDPSGPGKGAL